MNTFHRRPALVVIAVVAVVYACTAGDASRSKPESLRTHMERLASDECEGRGLGQPGLERAIAYAAGVFEAAGLSPGCRRNGEPTSFLQPVPFVRYRYGGQNRLTVDGAGGSRVLEHGDGMIILHPGRDLRPPGAVLPVFVGYGIHEPHMGHDDYAGVDVNGRWILVMEGVPEQASDELRRIYREPAQGPQRQYDAAIKHGAAGIIAIPSAQAYRYWDMFRQMRRAQSIAATRDYAGARFRDPVLPVVVLRQDVLLELFDGKGFDPVTRTGSYASFELTGWRIALTIDVEREELVSHNVVGFVAGNDPQRRSELVVVSAHIDHLGIIGGEIYNGANDDASGCAVIMEAARVIAADPQRRSALFVLFTSEENEHLGSLHFLSDLPMSGTTIEAGVNLEHVGRSNDGALLATSSGELHAAVEAVRASHSDRLRTAPVDERGQIVSGSDSYSFFLHGIPLVIVGGGGFPEYHSPEDDLQHIDYEFLSDAVTVTVDLIRELAGADRRYGGQ